MCSPPLSPQLGAGETLMLLQLLLLQLLLLGSSLVCWCIECAETGPSIREYV